MCWKVGLVHFFICLSRHGSSYSKYAGGRLGGVSLQKRERFLFFLLLPPDSFISVAYVSMGLNSFQCNVLVTQQLIQYFNSSISHIFPFLMILLDLNM